MCELLFSPRLLYLLFLRPHQRNRGRIDDAVSEHRAHWALEREISALAIFFTTAFVWFEHLLNFWHCAELYTLIEALEEPFSLIAS